MNSVIEELIKRIQEELEEHNKVLLEHGERLASLPAIITCIELVKQLAEYLILESDLKWEASVESHGGIFLVIQFLKTDRRLSCWISSDGQLVSALKIDGNMSSETIQDQIFNKEILKELTQWLKAS